MKYQTTFKRYEMKYMLDKKQKEAILHAMKPYMKIDGYGRTTIRNIYMDTADYRLVRRSMEKPTYKEKLRVRSYSSVKPQTPVFVEVKKKYKSVVYKRRLVLPEEQVRESFTSNQPLPVNSQIGDEVQYFRQYYGRLEPKVFISYEREAYYSLDGSDFRITFDENIRYRDFDVTLCHEPYGRLLMDEEHCLMEIKTSGGIPLWMSHVLTQKQLFKTSFSKYACAYKNMITEGMKVGIKDKEVAVC